VVEGVGRRISPRARAAAFAFGPWVPATAMVFLIVASEPQLPVWPAFVFAALGVIVGGGCA
jgi:hypothetical protein